VSFFESRLALVRVWTVFGMFCRRALLSVPVRQRRLSMRTSKAGPIMAIIRGRVVLGFGGLLGASPQARWYVRNTDHDDF
jgi:hypothetical protein